MTLLLTCSHWNSPRYFAIAKAIYGFSLFASAIKITEANVFIEYANIIFFLNKTFSKFCKSAKKNNENLFVSLLF